MMKNVQEEKEKSLYKTIISFHFSIFILKEILSSIHTLIMISRPFSLYETSFQLSITD